jgi:Domain of unknown function (DUF4232)
MIAPPKPPSHDELEALIKEARARQLRRRLLGAAGVAIAAALALSMYAVVTGGRVNSVTQANAGRASALFCSSSQLAMSIGGQGATELELGGALITNEGGQACVLPTGRPVVRITWQGRPLQVPQPVPAPGEVQSGTPVHVLAPGAKALISMRWGNWCGRRASGLPTFRLLFGHRLTLSAPGLGVPRCIGPGEPGFLDVSRPLLVRR